MGKLEIKISTPCNEKWDTFEKRGMNGFCQSCEKEVIDFTKMSDQEIKNYFKTSTSDVCGRMRSSQQKIYSDQFSSPLKPIASTLMAASALLFTGISTIAQSKDQTEQIDQKGKAKNRDTHKKENYKRIITGEVTDDSGESLPGVNVLIKGTTSGVQSNLDGLYRIEVKPSDIIVFSFVGFETQEVEVGARSVIDKIMGGATELGGIAVGGIQYRWYTPRGIWSRTKGLFRRIF